MSLYYFFKRSIPSILSWIFSDWRNLGIPKGAIVADFGSGSRPLPRADILVDRFLEGVTERPLDFIDTGAYLIQADLSALPFKDKAIDFIYSNHVIEHLPELGQSLDEMGRVGKSGYICCPAALREQVMALKMHLWFVSRGNGGLSIRAKSAPHPDHIGAFFDKLLAGPAANYWLDFEDRFKDVMFINYRWQDKINYTIEGAPGTWKQAGETEFPGGNSPILEARKRIIIAASKIIRRWQSKSFNILDLLCCPECKDNLSLDGDYLTCACGRRYRQKDERIFYFYKSA